MRKRSVAYLPCILLLSGCGSAELYRTSTVAPDEPGAQNDSGYVFLAPYFAKVRNDIEVSIVSGAKKTESTPAGPTTIGVRLIPVPETRVYLYLSRSALYSDAANVGVGSDGMLTSSTSSSSQQFTAILTELGQTAGGVLGGAGKLFAAHIESTPSDAQICAGAITQITQYGSFYQSFTYNIGSTIPHVQDGDGYEIKLDLFPPPLVPPHEYNLSTDNAGFLAFYPYPVTARLDCSLDDGSIIPLSPSITLNLYVDSHLMHPRRDFLSNPQDSFTLSEGFITGHQFSDQSPVKTVVDTITAPIRALLPSTTVTTSVQTGGGKPDQTTTSTAIGPPKSQ
jgi:hypothetical protein